MLCGTFRSNALQPSLTASYRIVRSGILLSLNLGPESTQVCDTGPHPHQKLNSKNHIHVDHHPTGNTIHIQSDI